MHFPPARPGMPAERRQGVPCRAIAAIGFCLVEHIPNKMCRPLLHPAEDLPPRTWQAPLAPVGGPVARRPRKTPWVDLSPVLPGVASAAARPLRNSLRRTLSGSPLPSRGQQAGASDAADGATSCSTRTGRNCDPPLPRVAGGNRRRQRTAAAAAPASPAGPDRVGIVLPLPPGPAGPARCRAFQRRTRLCRAARPGDRPVARGPLRPARRDARVPVASPPPSDAGRFLRPHAADSPRAVGGAARFRVLAAALPRPLRGSHSGLALDAGAAAADRGAAAGRDPARRQLAMQSPADRLPSNLRILGDSPCWPI